MQLHEKYQSQGLEAITINMEGPEQLEAAKATLQRLEIGLNNICLAEAMSDEALAAVQANGLLPEVNLYDRTGKLRHHFEATIDHEEVEQRVVELLAE